MGLDAYFIARKKGKKTKEVAYFRKHWTLHDFLCGPEADNPIVKELTADDVIHIGESSAYVLFTYYPPEGFKLAGKLGDLIEDNWTVTYEADW